MSTPRSRIPGPPPWRTAVAIALVAGSWLVPGCAGAPPDRTAALPATAGRALLLAAVTQTSDGHPVRFDDQVTFQFGREGGNATVRLRSAEIHRPILGGAAEARADPGLESNHGRLYALPVEPGRYRLDRFFVEWPSGYDLPLRSAGEFEAAADTVVYIGNLDAAFCIRHVYANQHGIAGIRLSVRDESARDWPLLRQRYPSLRDAAIVTQLLAPAPLQDAAAPLAKGCACARDCGVDGAARATPAD